MYPQDGTRQTQLRIAATISSNPLLLLQKTSIPIPIKAKTANPPPPPLTTNPIPSHPDTALLLSNTRSPQYTTHPPTRHSINLTHPPTPYNLPPCTPSQTPPTLPPAAPKIPHSMHSTLHTPFIHSPHSTNSPKPPQTPLTRSIDPIQSDQIQSNPIPFRPSIESQPLCRRRYRFPPHPVADERERERGVQDMGRAGVS